MRIENFSGIKCYKDSAVGLRFREKRIEIKSWMNNLQIPFLESIFRLVVSNTFCFYLDKIKVVYFGDFQKRFQNTFENRKFERKRSRAKLPLSPLKPEAKRVRG